MWRRKTLALHFIAIPLAFPLVLQAQDKPFTQDQVGKMMQAGLGDDSGSKLIGQRGIDFAPSEEFLRTLKAAGASEAFLDALRAAKPLVPASAKKPINQVQVFALLVGQVPSHRISMLIHERGIDFEPTDEYLQEVRLAGGEDELIGALKFAKATMVITVDSAARARQVEISRRAARGAEFALKRQFANAEQEYRAALSIDSHNPDVYASLAYVLDMQKKWDEDATAAREALRPDPNNELARYNLGDALGNKGDSDGEIAEYREALRLNPDSDAAHDLLGNALEKTGDLDGGITEFQEALRLDPNDDLTHVHLGFALGRKGDWDEMVTQEREALRLNPGNALAHLDLGIALGGKEDWDGKIHEDREAIRLNPNLPEAYTGLAIALGNMGDWDGVILEEHEVLRLDPNKGSSHKGLGMALEWKVDQRVALEELRAAFMLDPSEHFL